MIWDETKKELTIEWFERKKDKDEFHQIKKKPLRLQLHPTTGEVIRAHIKGARPAWVVKFASENRIRTHEAMTSEGKGWWISNWSNFSTEEKPLLCPFIKGMIEEWFEKLPEECQKDKDKLLKHLEIVEMNLLYHYEEFTKWGLHFKPEEILLDGGALVLDKCLLPFKEEEEDFQLTDWSEYQSVVRSLLEVREVPDELEVRARFDKIEDESFILELPAKQEEVLEDEGIVLEAEEELTALDDESIVNLDFSDEEELLFPSETLEPISQEFYEELEDKPKFEEVFLEEEAFVITGTEEEEILGEKEPEILTIIEKPDTIPLVVATKRSKKDSIVVGQTLLF